MQVLKYVRKILPGETKKIPIIHFMVKNPEQHGAMTPFSFCGAQRSSEPVYVCLADLLLLYPDL